jgi:outer membrane protein insertion porin family
MANAAWRRAELGGRRQTAAGARLTRRLAILLIALAALAWTGIALAADASPEPAPPSAAVLESTPAPAAKPPAGRSVAAANALDQPSEQFYGKIVSELKIEAPFYLDQGPIKRATNIAVGRPLERWRVRETLRSLYLLGDIENAAVIGEADGDKVKIDVRVFPGYVLRDINVVGVTAYSPSELLSDILRIDSGDDFRPENLDEYRQKVAEAMAAAGRFKAKVTTEVFKTKPQVDNKADLTIRVHEGDDYRISRFDFTGADLGVHTREEILHVTHWKDGMHFRKTDLDKGLARLKSWLADERYREASVPDVDYKDAESVRMDPKQSTVEIAFPLKIGPRVDIFYDNQCFSCAEMKWKFRDLLGLDNQKRFNEWIVADFVKRLSVYYQRQGYYTAQVKQTYRQTVEPNGQAVKTINLTVDKGPKVAIRRIRFHGNQKYDNKTLVELVTRRDWFVDEDFEKDLENVINYYNTHGYLRAIVANRNITYDESAEKIDIDVALSEGPQTKLRTLAFAGVGAFSPGGLQVQMGKSMPECLRVGQPFNPFLMQPTKTFILSEYFRKGYAKARIRDHVEFSEDGEYADLTFRLTEGILYRFGAVYVRGAKDTQKYIILRELVVYEGDPYNFEKIFRSEQALVQLGIFNSVKIAPVNPDFDTPTVDLMVTVDERKSGYITTDLGYNTFTGYNVAFEIGHRNLAGYDRALSFRQSIVLTSDHFDLDQRTTTVAFTWPWIARVPLDGTITLTAAQLNDIAYDDRSTTVDLLGSVALKKLFNFLEATAHNPATRETAAKAHNLVDPFTMQLYYEYTKDYIYNLSSAVTDEQQGSVALSTISPMIIHDVRDNVFNPTRWSYHSIRLDYGARWLLSQVDYLKVTARSSWYLPIFEAVKFLPGWVFAENVVVGQMQVLHRGDVIPISHRFFLGGSTTLRGYGQNEVSPYGTDNRTPVGGYFMAYQNTELRIPLGVYDLGVLGFFDAGNVTDDAKSFDVRAVRSGAGAGLRYLSPVGPISADLGFKLDKRASESLQEFYLTIGNAF